MKISSLVLYGISVFIINQYSSVLEYVCSVRVCRWPAVLTPDPWCSMDHVTREREGCLYHVEFLGRRHSHAWIVEEKVRQ